MFFKCVVCYIFCVCNIEYIKIYVQLLCFRLVLYTFLILERYTL